MAAAVQKFCSEFSYLDDYNNNNDDYDETKFHQCTTTVAITFASKLPSLYTAITDKHGNTNECLFINITNALADIIGSVYDSEICKVDAYPFDPNATQEYIQQKANLRNGLVQLSQTFHFYSFFATVASTHYCIEEVTAMNYITLLIKFVGIFKYSFFTPVG